MTSPVIKPLLEKLGYSDNDYCQQLQIKVGNNSFKLIPDFVILPNQSKGLLKVEGQHEFMVNVWEISGVDAADNEWLIENIKNIYLQYYHRVKQYKEDV